MINFEFESYTTEVDFVLSSISYAIKKLKKMGTS